MDESRMPNHWVLLILPFRNSLGETFIWSNFIIYLFIYFQDDEVGRHGTICTGGGGEEQTLGRGLRARYPTIATLLRTFHVGHMLTTSQGHNVHLQKTTYYYMQSSSCGLLRLMFIFGRRVDRKIRLCTRTTQKSTLSYNSSPSFNDIKF